VVVNGVQFTSSSSVTLHQKFTQQSIVQTVAWLLTTAHINIVKSGASGLTLVRYQAVLGLTYIKSQLLQTSQYGVQLQSIHLTLPRQVIIPVSQSTISSVATHMI